MSRAVPEWQLCDHASRAGVDMHLSSIESLLIALEQRVLDPDQVERFARLLQYGERNVMTHIKVRKRRTNGRAA